MLHVINIFFFTSPSLSLSLSLSPLLCLSISFSLSLSLSPFYFIFEYFLVIVQRQIRDFRPNPLKNNFLAKTKLVSQSLTFSAKLKHLYRSYMTQNDPPRPALLSFCCLIFGTQFLTTILLFNFCCMFKGAMKQGWGTCLTFKAFNLTYLHVLHS